MADSNYRRLERDAKTKQISEEAAKTAKLRAGILTNKQRMGAEALDIYIQHTETCRNLSEMGTQDARNLARKMLQALNYKDVSTEQNEISEKDGLRYQFDGSRILKLERRQILGRWVDWSITSRIPIRVFIDHLRIEAGRLFQGSKLI